MQKIPVRHINATQTEAFVFESFSIRDLRDLIAGKDMIQELHRHDFYYLLVLKKGKGNHEIDFVSYEICGNSVFFMSPGQVHQLSLKAASTGYLVQFKVDFYYPGDKKSNQQLRKVNNVNFYRFNNNEFEKLLSILNSIFEEYTEKKESYQEVIKSSLGILFIELIRHSGKGFTNNVIPYSQERLEEFLELVEANISTHKKVSQYADMLNLTLFQLNAITKLTLGKTSSKVINEYIILEAKRNLLATANQVSQIADLLGYEDVSYFIRFFRKQTGYSPELFRRNFK